MLNTPVLFLVFNRPDTTERVFEMIRQAKPKQLFIAADGPRTHKLDDTEKCSHVREIVTRIDWDCEVKKLFREKNLGCKYAVSSAVDWFFDNVEEGIILEDDTMPNQSFFDFCEIMLNHYRQHDQVMMIAGTNYFFGKFNQSNSYYFSSLAAIWGWATWKRTWKQYSLDGMQYDEAVIQPKLEKRYKHPRIVSWLKNMMDAAFTGKIDTWDIQLLHLLCVKEGLVVMPFKNLIQNIGYQGTHTQEHSVKNPFFEMPVFTIDVNSIVHPEKIQAGEKYDESNYTSIIKYSLTDSPVNRIRGLMPDSIRKVYRKVKEIIIDK